MRSSAFVVSPEKAKRDCVSPWPCQQRSHRARHAVLTSNAVAQRALARKALLNKNGCRNAGLSALCFMLYARTPCSLDYWDGRGVSTCLDLACITVARIQTALSALHRHGARCRAGAKGGARCRAAVGGPWGHLVHEMMGPALRAATGIGPFQRA